MTEQGKTFKQHVASCEICSDGKFPFPQGLCGRGHDAVIADEIARFPRQFGLRAFPGKVFRISPTASYISEQTVLLYTVVKSEHGWESFAKGTPDELRAEVVELEHAAHE